MMNRMVGSVLTLMSLLFSAGDAAAQTYTQMQWGMNKAVTPYAFGANINGAWSNLGTVSSAGVWNLSASVTFGSATKSVIEFGAKCDGVTDDTVAMQAAAAWVSGTNTGRTLILPPNACFVSDTITFNLSAGSVVGQGVGTSRIVYIGADTTKDIIRVGNGTFTPFNATLRGFTVMSRTTMTAGAAIHVTKASFAYFSDLETIAFNPSGNTLWNGVWLDQFDGIQMTRFRYVAQNDSLRVSGKGPFGPSKPQYDLWVTSGKLGGGVVGLHIGGGLDNIFFDALMITFNQYGIKVDNDIEDFGNQQIGIGPTVAVEYSSVANIWLEDLKCKEVNQGFFTFSGKSILSSYGLYIKDYPGCSVVMNGGYIAQNSVNGVRVVDSGAYLTISPSTQIIQNTGYGIASTFPYANLLSSGQLFGNNGAGAQYDPNVNTAKVGQTSTANTWTSAQTFNTGITTGVAGSSVGSVAFKNATSGTLTLQPAAGALGTVIATLPANTGTIAELNLAQTFSTNQTFSAAIVSAGTKPTVTGAGGTCAAGTVTGGALVGTVALTAACASTDTLALTSMPTVTNGYVCDAADRTSGVVNLVQTATTATSVTFTFNATTGAADVIQFKCVGY